MRAYEANYYSQKNDDLVFSFSFLMGMCYHSPAIDKLHIFNTVAVLVLDENYLQVHQPHCYSSCHSNCGLGSLGIWISWGTVFFSSPPFNLHLPDTLSLVCILQILFLSISYNLIDLTDD